MVKNSPATQEMWVPSLCWDDPLEKEMATHSSVLDWQIPWTEESGGYSPWGGGVGHDLVRKQLRQHSGSHHGALCKSHFFKMTTMIETLREKVSRKVFEIIKST